jgi:hypothetical protein
MNDACHCVMVRTFSVRILALGSHFSTADCQILQQDYEFSFSMVQIMANGTSPNATLCQVLVSRNDVVAYHMDSLCVNLSRADSFTYLGIEISSDLRWNKHVEAVVTKASRS